MRQDPADLAVGSRLLHAVGWRCRPELRQASPSAVSATSWDREACGFHGLRHSCAVQLERDGASLTVIRDTLGTAVPP